MPARCPSCGEEALTETARFCIGCGGPLPELEPGAVIAELAVQPEPLPPPARAAPADERETPAMRMPHAPSAPGAAPPPRARPTEDVPRFDPRPGPARQAAAPSPRRPAQPRATAPRAAVPLKDPSPIVPVSLVVAGIIGLLALLLLLLLAA